MKTTRKNPISLAGYESIAPAHKPIVVDYVFHYPAEEYGDAMAADPSHIHTETCAVGGKWYTSISKNGHEYNEYGKPSTLKENLRDAVPDSGVAARVIGTKIMAEAKKRSAARKTMLATMATNPRRKNPVARRNPPKADAQHLVKMAEYHLRDGDLQKAKSYVEKAYPLIDKAYPTKWAADLLSMTASIRAQLRRFGVEVARTTPKDGWKTFEQGRVNPKRKNPGADNEASFALLTQVLKYQRLPTNDGTLSRKVSPDEFMLMHVGDDGVAQFKHRVSRDYVFLTADGRMSLHSGSAGRMPYFPARDVKPNPKRKGSTSRRNPDLVGHYDVASPADIGDHDERYLLTRDGSRVRAFVRPYTGPAAGPYESLGFLDVQFDDSRMKRTTMSKGAIAAATTAANIDRAAERAREQAMSDENVQNAAVKENLKRRKNPGLHRGDRVRLTEYGVRHLGGSDMRTRQLLETERGIVENIDGPSRFDPMIYVTVRWDGHSRASRMGGEDVEPVSGKTNPRRKNPSAKAKPLSRAARAVKRVQEALAAGVILRFSTLKGEGTAGPYHEAVGKNNFAIFRDYRGAAQSDYYPSAFSAADHLVAFIGEGNAIEALKEAAKKVGLRYVNLDTPIPWTTGRRRF